MVEPNAFIVSELRTSLRAFCNVEQRHQLVKRKQLLLRAGIPAQQGQEVDDGLWEVAVLTVTTANIARLGVMPL